MKNVSGDVYPINLSKTKTVNFFKIAWSSTHFANLRKKSAACLARSNPIINHHELRKPADLMA
jgi:hypothetical protein